MYSQDAKRPRRIALVTHGFGLGGVSTVANWLRQSLESTGDYVVDVHVLATSRRDPYSRRITAPRTWGRNLRGERDASTRCQYWGANAVEIETMRYRPRGELLDRMRGYDLVQVVSGSPAWAVPVLNCGNPIVLQAATLVAWERQSQQPGWHPMVRLWRKFMATITSRIEGSALRRADAVLVENDAMLAHVRATGQQQAVKAPPGIDIHTFTPAASGWNQNSYLLSVCRLGDSRKGLDILVRAYERMVRDDELIPGLVLAGRGRLADPVASLIAELGLSDRVTIRSNVPPGELIDIYQRASVFVQTSHEEGLGMSMLEAMACGLPVVSTATNGAMEAVIHGRTGWLVDLDSADMPRAVADGVRAALTTAGRDAGALGRDRCVAEFSTGVCLQRFITTYDTLLRPAEVPAI